MTFTSDELSTAMLFSGGYWEKGMLIYTCLNLNIESIYDFVQPFIVHKNYLLHGH